MSLHYNVHEIFESRLNPSNDSNWRPSFWSETTTFLLEIFNTAFVC